MKKVIFILLFLSSMSVFAQTKTFIREYTYQASDYDSKVTARVNALEEVKRLLLEEVAVFMQSEFEDSRWEKRIGDEIQSGESTEKRIISITAGITQTEIIEEKWNGVEYWLKAKITIDPDEMKKQLDLILQDKEKTEELEKARQMADNARQEIQRLKEELKSVKNKKEKDALQKAYKKNIDQLDATDWFNKAKDADIQKEYNKVESFYLRAIELNPTYSDAYLNLGLAYFKQDRYQEAITSFYKVIELNPDDSDAYLDLGDCYRMQENYTDAIVCFNKAIEVNPDESNAYFYLGVAYYEQKDYTDAIVCFNKGIELNPDDSGAYFYFYLGLVYYDQKDYTDAIVCFNKAIEVNPDESNAYFYLGLAYRMQAIKYYQKSARLGDIDAQNELRKIGKEW